MFKWYRDKKLREQERIDAFEQRARDRAKTGGATYKTFKDVKMSGTNIYINGKKLEPGSTEYTEVKKMVETTMKGLGDVMGSVGQTVEDTMEQVGKALRNIKW